jgi:hypothetical protein
MPGPLRRNSRYAVANLFRGKNDPPPTWGVRLCSRHSSKAIVFQSFTKHRRAHDAAVLDTRRHFSECRQSSLGEGRIRMRSDMWSECGARARCRKPLPGGFGCTPGRHYDRSARSSLHWRRRGVTPVCIRRFQEALPEAEPGGNSPGERRGEAPRGERPEKGAAAPEALGDGNIAGRGAAQGRLRLSALRHPSTLFVRRAFSGSGFGCARRGYAARMSKLVCYPSSWGGREVALEGDGRGAGAVVLRGSLREHLRRKRCLRHPHPR